MPLQDDARKLHTIVRNFFRYSLKSANKAYFPPRQDVVVTDDPTGFFDELPYSKKGFRNVFQASAMPFLLSLQEKRGKQSIFQNGWLIARQSNPATRTGNCTEMGFMVAWLCLALDMPWDICLVDIEEPGDHNFCIMGLKLQPAWRTVRDFARDFSSHWVIDPWANCCCPLRDYPEAFQAKMRKWNDKGKRIWTDGSSHGAGWYSPVSDAWLRGFLDGSLTHHMASAGESDRAASRPLALQLSGNADLLAPKHPWPSDLPDFLRNDAAEPEKAPVSPFSTWAYGLPYAAASPEKKEKKKKKNPLSPPALPQASPDDEDWPFAPQPAAQLQSNSARQANYQPGKRRKL